MAPWVDFITERDCHVYREAGYGLRLPYGERPAIVVIDVIYEFVGDRPEPILESIKRWPNSCGEEGWQAVATIQELLKVARASKLPVVYTDVLGDGDLAGTWRNATYSMVGRSPEYAAAPKIVAEVAPQPQDLIISKPAPSAFFGTSLVSHLTKLEVDSLIITGCTTSGCVRASVVDAASYGYDVKVVAEGTFDRGQASHAINLFDMDAKYADVIGIDDACTYIERLPTGLFDGSSSR